MRTPYGKDCRYYYQDFHRGASRQECRLASAVTGRTLPWRPKDCANCPVPEILQANSSRDMELTLTITPVILGMGRRLSVQAHCRRHNTPIADAFVGCPACNSDRPGLDQFLRALEQDDAQQKPTDKG